PSGRAIVPPPRFFIGAADTPIDPPTDWRPEVLRTKIESGARFVQTQFCFDAAMVARYLARLTEAGIAVGREVFFLIGVGPLASARSARWMNAHLPGVTVPDAIIERLARALDPAAEGRRLCAELIDALRTVPGVAGVHIMAPKGGAEAIARVIDAAGPTS
ncbi:MAG: methylenetetrahydrofolate reductase, partial [Alphaproteobacteria bacterium]